MYNVYFKSNVHYFAQEINRLVVHNAENNNHFCFIDIYFKLWIFLTIILLKNNIYNSILE